MATATWPLDARRAKAVIVSYCTYVSSATLWSSGSHFAPRPVQLCREQWGFVAG